MPKTKNCLNFHLLFKLLFYVRVILERLTADKNIWCFKKWESLTFQTAFLKIVVLVYFQGKVLIARADENVNVNPQQTLAKERIH